MATLAAQPDDWKHEELTRPRPIPAPKLIWTLQEMDQIRLGLRPRSRDDKWFAFFDNDTVHLHRSASGHGIFDATFRHVEAVGFVIDQAVVTGDLSRYHRGTDETESAKLAGLISVLLAGRPAMPHARVAVEQGHRDRIHRVTSLREREGAAVQVDGPQLRVYDAIERVIDEIDMTEFGQIHFSRTHMLTNQNCNFFAGQPGRSSPLAFSVVRYSRFGQSLVANNWYRTGGVPEMRATYSYIGD